VVQATHICVTPWEKRRRLYERAGGRGRLADRGQEGGGNRISRMILSAE